MTTAEQEATARLIATRLGVTLAEAHRITQHLERVQPGRLAALTTEEHPMTDQPIQPETTFAPGHQVHVAGHGAGQWLIDAIDTDQAVAQIHNGAGETLTVPLAALTPTWQEYAARQYEQAPGE
jgi:hypothetical protein